jgi:transcriptional antiterminator RfaH
MADPALIPRPCGSYWAVVQTHPQAERWAKANLDRQGYTTFLPLMAVRVRDRATPTLWHTVKRPLFTSYLFVVANQHWAPIASSRGVRKLLMSDGKPGRVDWWAIEALQALQGLPPPSDAWEPGTPCSLALGPLQQHPAVVLKVDGQKATVSMLFFGALREMTVPLENLMARE